MKTLKVMFLKGCPGSGKSFWAKEQIAKDPDNWARINKDDLRGMLFNNIWSKEKELLIEKMEESLLLLALTQNKNVVLDNTHFHNHHEERFRKVCTEFVDNYTGTKQVWNNSEYEYKLIPNPTYKIDFEIKLFDTDLTTCLIRNAGRQHPVPEKIIREMYNAHIRPLREAKIAPYNSSLTNYYLSDLDGTLALLSGRNAYDRDFINDKLNKPVKNLLDKLAPTPIILVSGRNDKYKPETVEWLKKHNVPYQYLYMRKDGDFRKDVEVKLEFYNNYFKDKINILGVFDDRVQCVKLWRSLGLTCFQICEGNF